MIYFVQADSDDDGPIKIGYSKNVDARMASLQTSTARPLRLIAVIDGSEDDERAIHARFANAHVRGEWFRPCAELRAYLDSLPPVEWVPRKTRPLRTRPRCQDLRPGQITPQEWKQWRADLGLSRREAVEAMGLSSIRTLEKWEQGKPCRTPGFIRKVMDAVRDEVVAERLRQSERQHDHASPLPGVVPLHR